MQKLFGLFLILHFLIISIDVRAATISGVVVDSATSKPVVGASIQVLGTKSGTQSDFDGHFRIAEVGSAIVDLRIAAVCYDAITISGLQATDSTSKNLRIALARRDSCEGSVTVSAQRGGGPFSIVRPPSPTKTKGSTSSTWLAPYLRFTATSMRGSSQLLLSWIDRTGKEKHSLTVEQPPRVVHAAVFYKDNESDPHVHSLDRKWHVKLSPKRSISHRIGTSRDGNILIDFCSIALDSVIATIYRDGKRRKVIGPMHYQIGRNFASDVFDDGSFGVALPMDPSNDSTLLRSFDSEGREVINRRIDRGIRHLYVGPEAKAIVIQDRSSWQLYCGDSLIIDMTSAREVRFPIIIGWQPTDETLCLYTEHSDSVSVRVVNYTTGAEIWRLSIAFPAGDDADWRIRDAIQINRYGVFALENIRAFNTQDVMSYVLFAVDLASSTRYLWPSSEDGEFVVAQRYSDPPRGFLKIYDNRLFGLTPEKFWEIDLDAIAEERDGWHKAR